MARIELLAFLKHPLAIFWTFVYPFGLFVIMNSIFGKPSFNGALSYSDYLISGIVVLTSISTALFSFTVPLIELRNRSNLKLLANMPLPSQFFFIAFTASRLFILVLFCAVFMFCLSHVAKYSVAITIKNTISLSVFIMAGALLAIGVGVSLASIIKNTSTALAVTNVVNLPLIFLSNLFLPVSLFPNWMQTVAKISPVFWFVHAFRSLYMEQMSFFTYFVWVSSMIIIGTSLLFCSAKYFAWMPSR